MEIDKVFVALLSLGGIIFTFWFFLMRKDEMSEVKNNNIDILVEGGYKPSSIAIPFGETVKLNFLRKDPSSCLEEIVMGDFNIRKFLPLNEKITLEITPKKKGEFGFSCGMGMFHGKLIVH